MREARGVREETQTIGGPREVWLMIGRRRCATESGTKPDRTTTGRLRPSPDGVRVIR